MIKIEIGNEYVEPGFSATDLADGEVQAFSLLDRMPNVLDVNGYMESGRDNNIEMLSYDQNGGFMSLEPVGRTQLLTVTLLVLMAMVPSAL